MKNKRRYILLILLLSLGLLLSACQDASNEGLDESNNVPNEAINDKNMQLVVKTEDNDRILEKEKTTGKYYINGHEINFNYSFENKVSNSSGSSSTYMSLVPGEDFTIGEDWFGFVDYTTDFFGSQSKKKVLVITLENIESAKIDRYASGAYNDSIHYEENSARLIIDPATGKVLDMLSPNFYYDHGSQKHSTKNNYSNIYD